MVALDVNLRGPVRDFYLETLAYQGPKRIREVVFRGPAGTSKSRSILQMLVLLGAQFPGLRVLLCRRYRSTMSESTLVEFENCFPVGFWEGEARKNRSTYQFNGSEFYAAGLDEPTKLYSTSWDIVYLEEVNELGITMSAWEEFHRGLRNWRLPGQQLLIGSYNPSTPDHWVERRCDDGKCRRILTTFADNPKWHNGALLANGEYDPLGYNEEGVAYTENLRRLTGPRYKRLYLGEPSTAEGAFYPEFDHDLHVVDLRIREEDGTFLIDCPRHGIERAKIEWTMGAMDFGITAPGVFQLWACDTERRFWMLHEMYRTGLRHDQWADELVALWRKYSFMVVWADPSDKEAILALNYRLAVERGGSPEGDDMPGIVHGADNRKRGDRRGFEAVRTFLSKRIAGAPGMLFNRNALMHAPESELRLKGRCVDLQTEMANFVFWQKDDGRPAIDEPDPACDDHSMDTLRYFCTGAYSLDLRDPPRAVLCKPGTVGAQPTWPGNLTFEEWLETCSQPN